MTVAWCIACEGPMDTDERGCIPCREIGRTIQRNYRARHRRQIADGAKQRRDALTAAGLCITGKSHGPATHGRLCGWCRDVHNRGIKAVLINPRFRNPTERQ